MEWLKKILGDAYTDDIAAKAAAAIADGYVLRSDHDAVVAEKTGLEAQLKESNATIDSMKGQEKAEAQKTADDWQQRYDQLKSDTAAEIAGLKFAGVLGDAVRGAKGLSAVSIRAELGEEKVAALMNSKNQAEDIKQALAGLKTDKAFLFEADAPPPAPQLPAGIGTAQVTQPLGTGGLRESVSDALFGQK